MCKTFTNLYSKCPSCDRERITRVLQLWQKYSIVDAELLDKLNKIAASARIDSALTEANATTQPVDAQPNHHHHKSKASKKNDFEKLKKLKHLQEKMFKQQQGENKTSAGLNSAEKATSDSASASAGGGAEASASEKNFLNKIDNNLINEINKITSELLNKSSKKKVKSSTPPITTKSEISQVS